MFAPGPDPEMLAEVSAKLGKAAGLPAKPTGVFANDGDGVAKRGKGCCELADTPCARAGLGASRRPERSLHQDGGVRSGATWDVVSTVPRRLHADIWRLGNARSVVHISCNASD